ncbi:MAG: ABC transporter permease [Halobacteriaceae archaeon]
MAGATDTDRASPFGEDQRDGYNTQRRIALWAVTGTALILSEIAAVLHFISTLIGDFITSQFWPGTVGLDLANDAAAATADLPTLLSREVIPNAGYWNGEEWVKTFSALDPILRPLVELGGGTYNGLSPAVSWGLRVLLVYGWAFALLAWIIWGYRLYRRHYRVADWTPRDDIVDRFSSHNWGITGFVIVFLFVVMAVFAPTLGPTTVQSNMVNTYDPVHRFKYWDEEAGEVNSILPGPANSNSQSVGDSPKVAPMTYDDYGRFHPFGTDPKGQDLFTFIAAGSRISLIIGLLAVGLSALFATTFALVSAYYKDRVDLGFVLLSDAVMAMPQLLLLIMLSYVLADTWLGKIYSGALVLALIFAFTGWTYMWRSLRGPALQVAEREWIDAARSFGQRPRTIMRKHMFPYIVGYLLIYGSMTLGGAIIAIAGLSYLGLGVAPPTPEWGRAINMGQPYVNTGSWYISLIPGVLITIVVTGFNALGDGIRDAIDPQSDSATGEAAGRGGGA